MVMGVCSNCGHFGPVGGATGSGGRKDRPRLPESPKPPTKSSFGQFAVAAVLLFLAVGYCSSQRSAPNRTSTARSAVAPAGSIESNPVVVPVAPAAEAAPYSPPTDEEMRAKLKAYRASHPTGIDFVGKLRGTWRVTDARIHGRIESLKTACGDVDNLTISTSGNSMRLHQAGSVTELTVPENDSVILDFTYSRGSGKVVLIGDDHIALHFMDPNPASRHSEGFASYRRCS